MGVENLVVAPKAMGQDKQQKTDRRDGAELTDALDRYLRGNGKAWAELPKAFPPSSYGLRRTSSGRNRLPIRQAPGLSPMAPSDFASDLHWLDTSEEASSDRSAFRR
jgi:hypothetical protein